MKSRAQLDTRTHDALRPACPTSSGRFPCQRLSNVHFWRKITGLHYFFISLKISANLYSVEQFTSTKARSLHVKWPKPQSSNRQLTQSNVSVN